MTKRIFTYFVSLICCAGLAQDIHFSQFNEHHAILNPALTGARGNFRAVMGQKSQWRRLTMPYKTQAISVEGTVLRGTWRKGGKGQLNFRDPSVGRVAIGGAIYQDRAGDGLMRTKQHILSVASFVHTGRHSFLSAGIQASFVSRRVDPTHLIFPNQYNGTFYDYGMNSGELIDTDKFRYLDYGAGLLWCYDYQEKRFSTNRQRKFTIGAAAYHLTEPSQRFLGNIERLPMKYVAHADMLFTFNTKLALQPAFIMQMQGTHREMLGGAMIKYYFLSTGTTYTGFVKRTNISGGVYYRSNDAIVMQFLMEFHEQYAIGISNDFTISALSGASRRAGMEISLRYSPPNSFLYQNRRGY